MPEIEASEKRQGLHLAGFRSAAVESKENFLAGTPKMPAKCESQARQVTLGADKGYDTKDFVKEMRGINVTPHVAQNDKRPGGSAIDGRTTRHAGYQVSQRKRKRIEEVFGWVKTVGMLRKTRHRGVETVAWVFTFTVTAYNLVRMRNLLSPVIQFA
jgi:IS5 family transposase